MTKYELLRALEPFTDEVDILCVDKEHEFLFSPKMYYGLSADGAGQIILGSHKPENKKWVELKV